MWGCVMCSGTAPVQAALCWSAHTHLCSRKPQGVVALRDGDARGLRAAGQIVHSWVRAWRAGRSASARGLYDECTIPSTVLDACWEPIDCRGSNGKAPTHQCWSILPASPPQPAMIKATTVGCQLWQLGSSAFATASSNAVSLRNTRLDNPLTSLNDRQAPP
jgi:hypothetical protein